MASVSLTSCAKPHVRPDVEPYLQPCVPAGIHPTLDALLADPESTTRHLIDFAGHADDALRLCNEDKQSIRNLIEETP